MLLTSVGPFTPSRWYQRKEELWVSFGFVNEISEVLCAAGTAATVAFLQVKHCCSL
jgi:hypothetical protein